MRDLAALLRGRALGSARASATAVTFDRDMLYSVSLSPSPCSELPSSDGELSPSCLHDRRTEPKVTPARPTVPMRGTVAMATYGIRKRALRSPSRSPKYRKGEARFLDKHVVLTSFADVMKYALRDRITSSRSCITVLPRCAGRSGRIARRLSREHMRRHPAGRTSRSLTGKRLMMLLRRGRKRRTLRVDVSREVGSLNVLQASERCQRSGRAGRKGMSMTW